MSCEKTVPRNSRWDNMYESADPRVERVERFAYLPTNLPTYLPIYLPTYLPTYLILSYLHTYLPTYLPTYLVSS